MYIPQSARQHGGVAYREEDRGDEVTDVGGTSNKAADDLAAKEAADKAAAEKVAKEQADKEAADEARAKEKAEREKNIQIPKARYDEAVAKERERADKAEKEAAELRAARQASADVQKLQGEISDLEEQLDKALADNNPAEKKRIRAEIKAREEAVMDARVAARAAVARAEAVEQVRYDNVVDRLESDYPFLAEGAEDFDVDLTQTLLVTKRGYEAAGMSSSEALKATLKMPAMKAALEAAKEARKPKATTEDKAAADKAAAEAKSKAEAAEAKRREEAVAKGAAAAKGQPAAKTGDTGTADKGIKEIKVKDLSEKDFNKLPEDELKRLRGDSL